MSLSLPQIIKINFLLCFFLAKIIGLVPFSLRINSYKVYSSATASTFVLLINIFNIFMLYNLWQTICFLWNLLNSNLEILLILIETVHHIVNFVLIHLLQVYRKTDLIRLINEGVNIWHSIKRLLPPDEKSSNHHSFFDKKFVEIYQIQIFLSLFYIFDILFYTIWSFIYYGSVLTFWLVLLLTIFCICQFYVSGGMLLAWLFFHTVNKKVKFVICKQKFNIDQKPIKDIFKTNHVFNEISVLYTRSLVFFEQFFNIFKFQILSVILVTYWNITKSVSFDF